MPDEGGSNRPGVGIRSRGKAVRSETSQLNEPRASTSFLYHSTVCRSPLSSGVVALQPSVLAATVVSAAISYSVGRSERAPKKGSIGLPTTSTSLVTISQIETRLPEPRSIVFPSISGPIAAVRRPSITSPM